MTTPDLTLHHSPNTRSTGALILLEELGAPYTLHAMNMKAGENRAPAYLAINPLGKVPAVTHGDAIVTEQVAVYLYLADLHPQAGLAPSVGDALRGPYLRWMAFYGSSFEPAMVDHALKRPPVPPSMCPYGDVDTVFKTVTDQLAPGPFLLGDRFTAADVLWGAALDWAIGSKAIEPTPVFKAYAERVLARPGVARARALDRALMAQRAWADDKENRR